MPRNSWQMAALRPPAIAVHDDGEVLRKAFEIQFSEKLRFLAIGRFKKFAGFHRTLLEGPRGNNRSADNP
jgi:hypothetical protein